MFAVVLAALSLAARAGAQPAPSIDYVHVCGVALGMSQAQAEHAAKRNIHQASFAKRQAYFTAYPRRPAPYCSAKIFPMVPTRNWVMRLPSRSFP